ncbi:MAG: hypothetical protein WCF77_03600 [Minisyncoccia bacterium]|jgi:hypothetical protein
MITIVLSITVAALLAAYGFASRKINRLDAQNFDLKSQIDALYEPKTFGLYALECVGSVLNKLTADVVQAAYAAASVCGMTITIANDVAAEQDQLALTISQNKMEIENLKDRILDTENRLALNGRRSGMLKDISGMLPK